MHFLKIWVLCEQTGLKPSYEQKAFSDHEKHARLRLIGSRDGRDGRVDVCFGLRAPERFELNWIETNPDEGWFVLLRIYGPLEPILPPGWGWNDLPGVYRRDLFEGQWRLATRTDWRLVEPGCSRNPNEKIWERIHP